MLYVRSRSKRKDTRLHCLVYPAIPPCIGWHRPLSSSTNKGLNTAQVTPIPLQCNLTALRNFNLCTGCTGVPSRGLLVFRFTGRRCCSLLIGYRISQVEAHFSPDNSRGLPGSTSQGIACILQWLGAKKKIWKWEISPQLMSKNEEDTWRHHVSPCLMAKSGHHLTPSPCGPSFSGPHDALLPTPRWRAPAPDEGLMEAQHTPTLYKTPTRNYGLVENFHT